MVYVRRANLLLNSQSKLALEYSHALHSTEIPLVLSSTVAKLKARVEEAVAFDASVAKDESELVVKGVIDSDYGLIPDSTQSNDAALAKCSAYLVGYRETHKISSKTSEKLADKLLLLQTLHELAEKFESEMESEEAETHLRLLESHAATANVRNEILFLKDMLEQCKSWESKVSQLFSRISQSAEKKSMLLELPTEIPAVDVWMDKVQESLKLKPDLSAAAELLQQSGAQPIKRRTTIKRLAALQAGYADWEKLHNNLISEGANCTEFQELFKKFVECGAGHYERMVAALKAYADFLKWNVVGQKLLNEGRRLDEKTGAVVVPNCGVEDLARTLASCDRAPMKNKEVIQGLRARQAEAEKWKQDYASLPAQEAGLAMLRVFLTQGERYKLLLPELKHIQVQIELLESIESYTKSSESISYDKLSELINKAISNNISEAVLAPVRQALENAKGLVSQSEKLIEQCSASYKSIDQVYRCLKEIKDRKMQSKHTETLENLAKCYEWYTQLAERFKLPSGAEPDLATLETLSSDELNEQLAESAKLEPLAGPAQGLQLKLMQVDWSHLAKAKLDPTVKLSADDFKKLVDRMQICSLDSKHPRYGELCKLAQDSYENYKSLNAQYESLLNLDVDVLSESQLDSEVEKIRALKQSCFTSQVNMSESINRLHKLEKWVLSYQTLLKLIEAKESSGIDPGVYIRAYDNCASLQEGVRSKVLERTKEQVERYRNWMERFSKYKAIREHHDDDTLFDLEAVRKMVAEAASLDFPVGQEVSQLRADIDASERNEEMAREFVKATKTGTGAKLEEIQSLVQKIQALPLYSKSVMCALKANLWIAQVKQIIEGPSQSKRSLEEWNALIKERDRLLSVQSEDESFKEVLRGDTVDRLVSQHREAMLLSKQVNDLKSREVRDDFSAVDLALLLDLLKKSPIDFGQDLAFVGDMLDAAQSFESKLNELKASRAAFDEFDFLRERIKKIPINFGAVKSELESILQSAEILAKRIDLIAADFLKRKAKMGEQLVTELLVEYARIPCTFEEGENLKQRLEYCKSVIVSGREKLSPGKPVSLDEISQIANNIFDLPLDMAESAKPIKLEVCRRKYEAIIQNADKADYKPTFATLKSLATDFASLEDVTDSLDATKITHLKQLADEASKDMTKIQQVTDKTELTKLEGELAKKCVDYSEPIIEQRTRLSMKTEDKSSAAASALLTGKRERPEPETSAKERIWTPTEEEMLQCAAFRENTRTEFRTIIRENERLIREQTSEWFATQLELELHANSKDVNASYREMAEAAKRALKKIAEYPLLSAYIGNGKLPLWKLCKIKDQGVLIKKLSKIEGLLSKKGKKKKVEEDTVDPEAAATARRNLRLNLLLQEDKGPKSESPMKYDPLQPVESSAAATTYPGQMYDPAASQPVQSASIQPSVQPSVIAPQPMQNPPAPEQKNEDESLESVEIAGAKTFSSDEEEKQPAPPLFDPGAAPYQPGLPKDDVPYNPLDVDTSSARHPPRPPPSSKSHKGRNILVPYTYDPSRPEPERKDIPAGTLLHVWSGKLETGRVVFSCDMMTCESVKDYYSVPALSSYIEIDGRAKSGEVMQYLDSNFNTSKIIILRGWVTPMQTPESIENITKYVAELEKAGKCGVIDIRELNSHLYLIPWNARNQQFHHRWGIFPVGEQPLDLPLVKLAYFFAFKRRDFHGIYKPMCPVEIRKLEPSETASLGYEPMQVASGFPGIAQEELSDEEDLPRAQPSVSAVPAMPGMQQPVPIEAPSPKLKQQPAQRMDERRNMEDANAHDAITRNLKERLAALSPPEIETLRSRLDEKNRESFQRLIDEVFPQGIYGPRVSMEPMQMQMSPPRPMPPTRQEVPQMQEEMLPPPPMKVEALPSRPIMEPPLLIQNLANDPNYNQKVQMVQKFIEKNKALFLGFVQNMSQGGAPQMMFPEQPPPPGQGGRYIIVNME